MADNKNQKGRRPYYGRRRNSGFRPKKQETGPSAPHPQFPTVAVLEKALADNPTEEAYVHAVGIAWNKYAFYEEAEDTIENDLDKLSEACDVTDTWCECYYRLVEKLKSMTGMDPDSTFALPELSALMDKYGFEDVNGLWQRKKPAKNPPKND